MMQLPSDRLLSRLLLSLTLVAGPASLAQAQYQGPYQPPAPLRPTLQTQGSTPSPGATYNITSTNGNGGGGFGGYGGFGWGGYYPGPVGGALQGVAAVTNANGQYLQQTQQARILNNAANTGQLDYRQRLIEQWQYEKSLQPTPEDLKQQEITQALRRARNGAPNNEIWSGVALNTLYNNIKKAQQAGIRGPMVPVDPKTLRHINLTSGNTSSSAGMLKNGGDLEWPQALQARDYKENKDKIDKLARQTFQQASTTGQVAPETISDLSGAIAALAARVDTDTGNLKLSYDSSNRALRFINQLNSTVKSLEDPNAVKQLNGQWAAQGGNVAALIDFMAKNGLSFAAATQGGENFYNSLYNDFLSYDMGLSSLSAANRPQVQASGDAPGNR